MSTARNYFKGRSELFLALIIAAGGVALAIATSRMKIAGSETIGPDTFPYLVAILMMGVGIALTIQVLMRKGSPAKEHDVAPTSEFSTDMLEDLSGSRHGALLADAGKGISKAPGLRAANLAEQQTAAKTGTDWKTVGLVLAGLAGFAALINVLGFVLAAAGLFWVVCYALGSKRPVFDVGVGVILAAVLQFAFGLGLGLSLPSGIFGVMFGGA